MDSFNTGTGFRGVMTRKAFSLLEVAIAVAVVGILSTIYIGSLRPFFEKKKKEETIERMEKLKENLAAYYRWVIEWRRKHPNWGSYGCGSSNPPLLPPGCTFSSSDTQKLDFYSVTIGKKEEFRSLMRDAGCYVKHSTSIYDTFQCTDGWGNLLHYSYSSNWYNNKVSPYNYNSPITITITSAGKDGTFGTSDDLSVTFSTASLDMELKEKTMKELSTIADTLDAYFKKRLAVEITERTLPNGLSELDDLKVNWFLQLCTDHPYDTCSDSSCTNIDWGTKNCSTSPTFDTCNVDTVLSNLHLGSEYRTDYFGNPIHINLCYSSDSSYADTPDVHDAPGPFVASVSNGIDTVFAEGM